jgi:hypothetical protein
VVRGFNHAAAGSAFDDDVAVDADRIRRSHHFPDGQEAGTRLRRSQAASIA